MKADFLYFEALASFQTERYEEADTLVAQITDDEVSKIRKAPYYKLVGDLRHRDQDYDAAFFAYKNGNQAVKSGLEYKRLEREAGHYFESLKNTARQLEQLLIEVYFREALSGRAATDILSWIPKIWRCWTRYSGRTQECR